MKQITGFEKSLGPIGEVFLPEGEIQQMLNTSKRFTDQLDDMLLDKPASLQTGFGPDTLKEYDEHNDLRIAEVFHDVAKGQVLETFVDYTKKLTEAIEIPQDNRISHDILRNALQNKIGKAFEALSIGQEPVGNPVGIGANLNVTFTWLLPELLIRPIHRAFMIAKDVNDIKSAVEKELVDLKTNQNSTAQVNMTDRFTWLDKELDTLEKVTEEAEKVVKGLHHLIQDDDWCNKYSASFDGQSSMSRKVTTTFITTTDIQCRREDYQFHQGKDEQSDILQV